MKPRRARRRVQCIAFLLLALVVTGTTSTTAFAGGPQQLGGAKKAPAAQRRSPRFWLAFAISSHPAMNPNDDITGGMITGLPLPGLQFGVNVLPSLSLDLTFLTIGVFNAAEAKAKAYFFRSSTAPYAWAGASGGFSTSLLEDEIGDLGAISGGLGVEFGRQTHFFASIEQGVEVLFTQGDTLPSFPIRFAIGGRL